MCNGLFILYFGLRLNWVKIASLVSMKKIE